MRSIFAMSSISCVQFLKVITTLAT